MLVVKWVLQILRIDRLGLRFAVEFGHGNSANRLLVAKAVRAVVCHAKLPLFKIVVPIDAVDEMTRLDPEAKPKPKRSVNFDPAFDSKFMRINLSGSSL